jgi:hypothetical protein
MIEIVRERKRQYSRATEKAHDTMSRRQFKCLYPKCEGKAVKCHSQQKMHQLESIAEDGIVFTQSNSFKSFIGKTLEDPLSIVSMGISKASTFDGFCSYHDHFLFDPIENGNLDFNNNDHINRLMLRAIAYEFCEKRRAHLFMLLQKKYLQPYTVVDPPLYIAFGYWLQKLGVILLDRIFTILSSSITNGINFRHSHIQKNIGISACGYSGLGDSIYNMKNYTHISNCVPTYAYHIIPSSDSTNLIIAWFVEYTLSIIKDFGNLLAPENLSKLINKIAFVESENTCISPKIWNAFSDEEQRNIGLCIRNNELVGTPEIPDFISI